MEWVQGVEDLRSILVLGVGMVPVRAGSLRVEPQARSELWPGPQRIVVFIHDETGESMVVHATAVAGLVGQPERRRTAEERFAAELKTERARLQWKVEHAEGDPVANGQRHTRVVTYTAPPGRVLNQKGKAMLRNAARNNPEMVSCDIADASVVMRVAGQGDMSGILSTPGLTDEVPVEEPV